MLKPLAFQNPQIPDFAQGYACLSLVWASQLQAKSGPAEARIVKAAPIAVECACYGDTCFNVGIGRRYCFGRDSSVRSSCVQPGGACSHRVAGHVGGAIRNSGGVVGTVSQAPSLSGDAAGLPPLEGTRRPVTLLA